MSTSRVSSARHLASWAGVCPGNNESAGKHSSGTTRPDDPWLKSVLGHAAISASRIKDTYLAARYRRIMARGGRKRALVAVQHSILIAVWHMFTNDMAYCDLGRTTSSNALARRAPPDASSESSTTSAIRSRSTRWLSHNHRPTTQHTTISYQRSSRHGTAGQSIRAIPGRIWKAIPDAPG